jgi:hypothetical protein
MHFMYTCHAHGMHDVQIVWRYATYLSALTPQLKYVLPIFINYTLVVQAYCHYCRAAATGAYIERAASKPTVVA